MKDAPFSSRGLPKQNGLKILYPGYIFGRIKETWSSMKAGYIFFLPLAFLLGRSNLMGEFAPFGAVFWLLLLREKPRESYPAAAAVLAGCVSAHGLFPTLLLFASMFLVWFWEALCLRLWNRKSPLVLSTILMVTAGNYFLLVEPLSSYLNIVFVFTKTGLGILAAYALKPAISMTKKLPFIRDRPLSDKEAVAGVIVFALALLGIRDIQIQTGGLNLVHLISKIVLIFTAYSTGAYRGAAVGIITGTILGLGNPGVYTYIGSLSFSGFVAGLARQFGRLSSGLAFVLAAPVITLASTWEIPVTAAIENLIAAGIFLLIPSPWLSRVKELLSFDIEPGEKINYSIQGQLQSKTRQLTEIFKELSECFYYREAAEEPREQKTPEVVNRLKDSICNQCWLVRKCWNHELYSNARLITGMVFNQERRVVEEDLPEAVRERCAQKESLLQELNRCKELWRVRDYWARRLRENQEIVSHQLLGISDVMEELNQELEYYPRYIPHIPREQNVPVLSLEIGIAQDIGKNENMCGDSYTFCEVDESKHAVIISDGMGSGPEAREESKTTVSLLDKMVKAGLSRKTIIKTVNSLLQIKDEKEKFATVDMAMIDLSRKEVEWVKAGGAPGYYKRDSRVKKIGRGSLPLGILKEIDTEEYKENILPGDLLVIVSDGVAASAGDWLPAFLSQYEQKHAQVIADRLLEEAIKRNGRGDDKTVIACRFVPF